jgi:ATP-binding cassette subfamily B protein
MRKYFLKYKGLLLINAIAIFLSVMANVYLAFVFKNIVDIGTSGTVDDLTRTLIFSLGFIFATLIIGYFRKVSEALYLKKTLLLFKNDIFEKVLGKNLKSFTEENSAKYISMLTNDINMIEQDYFVNMLQIIYNGVSFLMATLAIIQISVVITIGVFVVGALAIVIPGLFGTKLGHKKKLYSDNLGNFTTKVKDMFSGFEVIKSFNIENKIQREYESSNYSVENSKFKFNAFSAFVDAMSEGAGEFMFFTAMGIGTYFVIQGNLTVGTMIATVQLMNYIVNPLIILSTRINKLKGVKLIEEKVLSVASEAGSEDLGLSKTSFDCEIIFDKVDFSYNEERKALQGVSINIKRGKKYAIVGSSGCGKSTLLKLLLRYYEDFNGEILLDGIDNRNIKISDLYKLITVIHQNVFMFDDTIRENITLFKDYSEDEVKRAVSLAGLDELVARLSYGLDNHVGENGNNLSGGEKQRVAIARALVKNTPILVIDEATSALDNETAFHIEKSILNIKDITCLVVTHKLIEELLVKYDGIIVMKNGLAVEAGTFEELIEKKRYFYNLYNVTREEEQEICEKVS